MNTAKKPAAIRLSLTDEVNEALKIAKVSYPTLSDPEILKLGLARMVTEDLLIRATKELGEIRATAAGSVGSDYLNDPEEDIYGDYSGRSVVR
ncbi:hypothetical protein KBD20_02755 [Candidatus Saccharibacteria bacterium]|nr:hypothetical protein [Candidatus Saccharibacteria bacterium]